MSKRLALEVTGLLKAGALVVIVQEPDEQLALATVQAGASGFGALKFVSSTDNRTVTQELKALPTGSGVLVVSDLLSVFGTNPLTVRMIREVALQERDPGDRPSRLILIESPTTEIPKILLGDCELVTPSLPTVEELIEELEEFCTSQEYTLPGNGEVKYELAAAVAGVPRHKAAMLFSRCYLRNNRRKDDDGKKIPKDLDAGWLRQEKAREVTARLGGALSFEKALTTEVGGLDSLKAWLAPRQKAFGSSKAKEFGLPETKGVLLLGPPGCGKSLMAKVIAAIWQCALLRLDFGKVMGSLVGQSEGNMRAAIETGEACSPCVMWVDEIEKGLAGSGGSGSSDSGVGQRVFGTMLTWLQEKESPVFVVATANNIAGLPPELLRKGRFDEIFFVDLPTQAERAEIVRIHLAKRKGRTFTDADLVTIAQETPGFSGAELEAAVVSGLFEAYALGRDLEPDDVLKAAGETTPLSKTRADEIDALRKWAQGRARPATSKATTTTTKVKRVRRRGPENS